MLAEGNHGIASYEISPHADDRYFHLNSVPVGGTCIFATEN
jgi:hypothetical protein